MWSLFSCIPGRNRQWIALFRPWRRCTPRAMIPETGSAKPLRERGSTLRDRPCRADGRDQHIRKSHGVLSEFPMPSREELDMRSEAPVSFFAVRCFS